MRAVEPLAIAMHAVNRLHRSLDDTAVVVGAGVIGLMAVQVLRAAGCGKIIAADLDRRPAGFGLQAGCRPGVAIRRDRCPRGGDAADRQPGCRPGGGSGWHRPHRAIGRGLPAAGRAACLGGPPARRVELPVQDIVTRELTITGSYCSCEDYPACLDLMARGAIQIEPLISVVAPLAEGAAWFQRLHSGKDGLVKVLLEP